jgi:Fungal Zn(2)-Cys(6) binuclear cluster domain
MPASPGNYLLYVMGHLRSCISPLPVRVTPSATQRNNARRSIWPWVRSLSQTEKEGLVTPLISLSQRTNLIIKKCDRIQPSCSRCTRLGKPCIGYDQQRYKFVKDQSVTLKSASLDQKNRQVSAVTA